MKSLLLIALTFGFTNAFAANTKSIQFSYNGFNTYVSCNYVEGRAETILAKLGATNVKVNCTGGLEDYTPYIPPTATISFEQGGKTGATVTFNGFNDSCDFNVKLIDAILKDYDHSAVQKQESCWDSQGNYSYKIQL